mmetsp:Transcript_9274/g.25226  ORF Transcript_9274/g.25226 Transcript_9274/m.25226 type:complete len:282 (-) Transcript_9274:764-1609(-)
MTSWIPCSQDDYPALKAVADTRNESCAPTFPFEKYEWTDLDEELLSGCPAPTFDPESPHLPHRRTLIDFLYDVVDRYKLSKRTLHSAAHFLDKFCMAFEVRKSVLQIVATCSLVIAAKFEEREEMIPAYSRLSGELQRNHQMREFREMEVKILNELGWRTRCITPVSMKQVLASSLTFMASQVHAVMHFLSKGILFKSDVIGGRPIRPEIEFDVRHHAENYLDLVVLDYGFRNFNSLVIGAAVVHASRKSVNMKEVRISFLTGVLVSYCGHVRYGQKSWKR